MKGVYALFPDPDSAQLAVENLRAAGVADSDIMVVSSQPFEEYEFSHRDKATWISWIAPVGGAFGLGFGYWLTSMTERSWPLPTGGMPIVTPWTNLVIIFELTMLCTVLTTVATLLVTAKLPRRRTALYDPEVSDGKILVGLENLRNVPIEDLERALTVRTDISLKTIT